jgi:hypothetical protein
MGCDVMGWMLEKGKPLRNGMTRGGNDSTNSIKFNWCRAFFRLPERRQFFPFVLPGVEEESSCLSYFKAEQRPFDPCKASKQAASKHGHTSLSLSLPSLVAGLAFRADEARLFGSDARPERERW